MSKLALTGPLSTTLTFALTFSLVVVWEFSAGE
jgi:hypothetical protein